MRKLIASLLAALGLLTWQLETLALAADDKTDAIVDKAIKAVGGETKLKSSNIVSWKAKGKVSFNDSETEMTFSWLSQGLDQTREVFEMQFNGNTSQALTVLNGDQGWRELRGTVIDLDAAAVAGRKRAAYLQMVPVVLLPLKGKDFKVEAVGEEEVGDKVAVVIQVTGPDNKGFKLYFDKETGLPVKQVADVAGSLGEEVSLETTFGAYKDFGGIKKATEIKVWRDGERFIELEITDFKLLRNVDPKLFSPER